MSNWSGFTLTDMGADLQAKINAGVTTLALTKIGLGSGSSSGSINASTQMVNKVQDVQISKITPNNNIVEVDFTLTNKGLGSAYKMSEMGIFATDPDEGEILFAYMTDNTPDTMPADGSATVVSLDVTLNITFSNTGNVSATIDTGAFVTHDDLNTHNSTEDAHSAAFSAHNTDEQAHSGLFQKVKTELATHNTDSSAHTAILNAHNADVNAHNPITDMIASITGEPNWQTVPTHNLATVLNDSVKRAVDIVRGRADVILTPLIDWERIKTAKGGTDARTGSPTDNYLYALMKGSDVVGGKIYLKTAFTNYDELIFRLTDDDRSAVGDCTYNTKEFYEILNGKGEAVYIGCAGGNTGYETTVCYYWGFGTFNNPFSAFKSTANYLCTGATLGWENCGLIEIYGVTYPRA